MECIYGFETDAVQRGNIQTTHPAQPPFAFGSGGWRALTLGNKMNDLHCMTRSDMAEPYCHWAEDKEAIRPPMPVPRKVVSRVFYCLMVFICLAGLLQALIHSIPHYGIIMKSALACLGVVIISSIFVNRFPTIKCSACSNEMKPAQVNPPPGTPCDMQGQYGRIYCEIIGSGDDQRHWVRLMQELRVCKACKRYVVVQEAAHIVIGPSKQDVLEYEDRCNAVRHAIEGKKFGLRKQQPNKSARTTA